MLIRDTNDLYVHHVMHMSQGILLESRGSTGTWVNQVVVFLP